jgi:phosphoglycerol geranylgeranyltransferase
MKIWKFLSEKIKEEKLHFTLIDPDKQLPQIAGEIAFESFSAGTDAILIGGSSPIEKSIIGETIVEIKKRVRKSQERQIPIILFPSEARALNVLADGVLFMSLLNSKDLQYVIREAVEGTLHIKTMGLEPISTGYLIISPGMKAGQVGKAELLQRDDYRKALQYALYTKYFGAKLLYLEAGSGAPKPISNEMIKTIKTNVDIPLVVGGGIKNPEMVREKLKAGADIIVTGNVVERRENNQLEKIIRAVKEY